MKKGNSDDPKGLIFEAYRIEGITASECRSIFLDWALSLPLETDMRAVITRLLAHYEAQGPNHPMTTVLRDGLPNPTQRKRRGGWRSRARDPS